MSRARKQQHKIEIENQLSRRQLIKKGAIAGLALASGSSGFMLYKRLTAPPPSYIEAYDNPSKRQEWLEGLDSRPYVIKKFASLEDLEELKIKFDYTPQKNKDGNFSYFADTIVPLEDEIKVGQGAKSTLYLYESSCFAPALSNFKQSQKIIIENCIKNHELMHSDHYYSGIPNYPLNWFQNKDKTINKALFKAISEIICYKNEYKNLENIKEKDLFIKIYIHALNELARPYYDSLHKLTDNKELIEKAGLDIVF